MRMIDPYFVIEDAPDECSLLKKIERSARVCWKSEGKIQNTPNLEFLRKLLFKKHHESVFEHGSISVRFVCNRGFSHELVRHRIGKFSQESTRYANYSKDKFGNEITVIKPYWWDDLEGNPEPTRQMWKQCMETCEKTYLEHIRDGLPAQAARDVLPLALKTEIVMTTDIRHWRHVFKLRTAPSAHPDMRRLMIPLVSKLNKKYAVLFDDLIENINQTYGEVANEADKV